MSKSKTFPTPAMLKAREAWEKKPKAEKETFMNEFEAELKKYYGNRFPREVRKSLTEQHE